MPFPFPEETSLRLIVQSIRELWQGRSNAVGQFTCTPNQATTAVTAPNCGPSSKILITARHANAAAELGAGTIYISAVAPGTFTVTHANAATLSRIFDYAIQG